MPNISLVPSIGASGLYTLKSPYDTLLLAEVAYTCVAIRRIADLIDEDEDPKTTYYTAKSLSESVYTADLELDVCIISLQPNTGGEIVHVPSTYIASYPSGSGIKYAVMGLGISLGAVPVSLDLTYLKSKVTDIIAENLGIEATTNTLQISPVTLIDQDTHKRLETARTAAITDMETDNQKYLAYKAKYEAAVEKIAALEEYIVNLGKTTTVGG